ncbi:MAG: polyphosphate kinase [Actinomycetota bacterium]
MKRVLINRELSWLDFNARVLALTEEPSIPLLERLKFVAIFASNLDEFFQVRVGALHDRIEAGTEWSGADGMGAAETLAEIRKRVLDMSARGDDILAELLARLDRVGVTVCRESDLSADEVRFVNEWFESRVMPVLTPLAVDPAHPFPYISNLAVSLAVMVTDPGTGEERFARVKIPTGHRFLEVAPARYVPMEEVVGGRISRLFPGMEVSTTHVFRVTRNTDLDIDSEEAEDLLEAVEMELRRRRFGNAVRLEVDRDIDPRILDLLLEELDLEPEDVYRRDRFVGGNELWEIHAADRPDLKDEPWTSVTAGRLWSASVRGTSFFEVVRHRDLMVHHPYESFATSTEEFIRQAARDPKVRAIKATLYRTSSDSAIARDLIVAAERGVQVAALIELTARFDEQTNVRWARELERAGAHVVYGVVGLKTHAKCLLVVREEGDALRSYAHIGTGNYNSRTAATYEDIGIFTCDPAVTADVASLFNRLTGFSRGSDYRELVTAPDFLRPRMVELIRAEAARGASGSISMKMNALVDPVIIAELAAAARAGARIDLLVRGTCSMSLRDLSGTRIRIRSVLGRFLEHSRVYRFGAAGADGGPVYLMGSADMMPRNLDLRVEALVPVKHPKHRAWLDRMFEIMWADDVVRFELDEDDAWHRRGPADFVFAHDAQARLMRWATDLQLANGAPSTYDLDEHSDGTGTLGRFMARLRRTPAGSDAPAAS